MKFTVANKEMVELVLNALPHSRLGSFIQTLTAKKNLPSLADLEGKLLHEGTRLNMIQKYDGEEAVVVSTQKRFKKRFVSFGILIDKGQ